MSFTVPFSGTAAPSLVHSSGVGLTIYTNFLNVGKGSDAFFVPSATATPTSLAMGANRGRTKCPHSATLDMSTIPKP